MIARLLIDCFILGTVFGQGATIKKNEKNGAITIARIMKGGAADRSGELYLFVLIPPTNQLFFVFFSRREVVRYLHTLCNRTVGIY